MSSAVVRMLARSEPAPGSVTATARGGSASGNGGLIETSAKDSLDVFRSSVDAGAAHGTPGNWLLDPTTINIVDSTLSSEVINRNDSLYVGALGQAERTMTHDLFLDIYELKPFGALARVLSAASGCCS